MHNDKDLSTWQTFRRLWPMIAPFKAGLIVAGVALILNAASDTFMLSLLKPLLDDGFGKTDRSVLLWMPLVVIGLMILRGITSYISSYCISWVSGKVVMTMRRRLFSHMMGMPVSFFDKQSTGTLLSRITYDSEQVASSSSSALITVVREGASIIGLFIMMFYYSWQLSLILIVLAPVVSIAIRVVSKRFRNISKNMQNTMGQVTTSAEQMLKGHKEVLIFGGQDVETKRFDKVSNKMRLQGMKMVSASSISDPIIQLIASLALAFVLYAASFPSVMETLTAGTITVVFSSMIALMRPLKSLTNVNAQFQRGMAACQTLFSILDSEQEKDEGTREIERARGDVEFHNVTFTYPGRDTPALRNINLTIPAGKTVALVGRSGSGKSTIASLITRFYDINEFSWTVTTCGSTPCSRCVTRLRWFLRTCICLTIRSPTTSLMRALTSTAASRSRMPHAWPMRWTLSTRWITVWIPSLVKMACSCPVVSVSVLRLRARCCVTAQS